MKITITRSGGLTGISLTKNIDTKDLPEEKAKQIECLFTKSNLTSSANPDSFSYTITTEDNQVNQSITLPEAELTPELRELIKINSIPSIANKPGMV